MKPLSKRGPAAIAGLVLALCFAIAGCDPGQPAFNSIDITGAPYARDFALTDSSGKPRALADFKGKVVAVFFGYTHCPDVCPTTMADLAAIKQKLGPAGDGLQVVFITLDPERDTNPMLQSYVPKFDPSFIALRGDADQTAKTAKEFKVFYQKVAGDAPDAYTLDHTAGTFVFDRDGKIRLFVKYGETPDRVQADLKRLLG